MDRSAAVSLLVVAMSAPAGLGAQPTTGAPVERSHVFTIESRALGERRTVEVALPTRYATDTQARYPVVFVLDGEYEGEIAIAVARFYAAMEKLPPMIVVAIRNTNRMRDLTPPATAGFKVPSEAGQSGGAEAFLAFVEDELVPWTDRTFRAAPMRTLVGHSLGGLFAVYALAKRPALFTGYVVMEPAVWWNDRKEWEEMRATLARPQARRARVALVNTSPLAGVDTTRWGGDRPMVRYLRTVGETHQSMALEGMMQGLRSVLGDFLPGDWRPGTRPVELIARYDSLSARVGYAVPVPARVYETVARMSIHGRFFDDAERVIDRLERSYGAPAARGLRDLLAGERSQPQPASFVPLEIPRRRPTAADARAFIGRWRSIDPAGGHEVDVRASGDTIIVRDAIVFPTGDRFEADDPVIQVTRDGALEWGLPFFRGVPALVVLTGRVAADSTLTVTRQPRGWVPQQGGPELTAEQRFRRVPP